MKAASLSNPAKWLDLHGDTLYGYARLRVRDEHLAEDLVQETLLAALKSQDRFAGNASERTWLIGILKHKIIDHFRKSSRESLQSLEEESLYKNIENSFDEQGNWQIEIADWSRPDKALEQEEFWKILGYCIERLPPRLGRLFVLRELDGVESKEICEVLNISTTNNLWVMLSRMRMQLRNCLDIYWFEKSAS